MSAIRVIADAWGEARIEDVQKVIDSVADTFRVRAGIVPRDRILVRQNVNLAYPIALFEPAATGERVIELSTTDRFWCQLAYQFSHEYCHVFSRHYRSPLRHRFQWFEECLCELASLWCLACMSEDWKDCPPYPTWSGFSKNFEGYINDIMRDVERFGSADAFREWLRPQISEMSADPYHRERNRVVAVRLFGLFSRFPSMWKAVAEINEAPFLEGDFRSYLKSWRETVSSDLAPMVEAIAGQLGFPIARIAADG